jgi:hypothetical protein
MGLVTVCAVIAGIVRAIPAAWPELLLVGWFAIAAGKGLQSAYRQCGPDSQLFRMALFLLGIAGAILVLAIAAMLLTTILDARPHANGLV